MSLWNDCKIVGGALRDGFAQTDTVKNTKNYLAEVQAANDAAAKAQDGTAYWLQERAERKLNEAIALEAAAKEYKIG